MKTTTMNLDRGKLGEEGHYTTIDHHTVFIVDDTGTGANGRGGKFTKHGLEKKLIAHHESRGGFATHEHRDALAEDSGGDLMGRSRFTFHKSLPGEVRKHIENNPAARKLFRVSANAADAKGADALASLGDKYFDMADEAAGSHINAALDTAEKSDDPEARFHAAIYKNLPKTKTQQGIFPADKFREGDTFSINGTNMKVVNNDGELPIEGHGYPSTPLGVLSEVPIDKYSHKAGGRAKNPASREVVPFSATLELSQGNLFGGESHRGTGSNQGHLYGGKEVTGKLGEKGHYVTIHGAKLFIKHGQSVGAALREHFGEHGVTRQHIAHAASQIHEQGGTPNVEDKDKPATTRQDVQKRSMDRVKAKPETTSTPSDKIGRDTTPIAATKDEGPKLKPTAATTIAAQKGDDLDSKVDSNDLDGGAMRDLKAKSMERVKGKVGGEVKAGDPVTIESLKAITQHDEDSKRYVPVGKGKFGGRTVLHVERSGWVNVMVGGKVAKQFRVSDADASDHIKDMAFRESAKLPDQPAWTAPRASKRQELSAPSPYYLSASSTTTEATELSATLPKTFNGADIHYRWQDAAVSGQWKHPTKGFTLNIDNDRIDRWVRGIDLARANGVDLPIVKDHRETADSCLGYIYGARQNNGRLELLNGYIGADSLAIAQRNKLSIGIDPNFKDSRGTSYGEAIRHVAVTPIPVIHGQQGFLAASRDGQQEAEYLIPVAKENNDMTLTDEQRKEICDVLGVEHVDDDAAISLLTATVTDLQNECLTLSAAQDAASAKITELSAAATPVVVDHKPDPRDIELAKARIELSATKGDVPAWLAKALTAKLDNSVLLLSRDGDDKPTFVAELLQLFEGSKLGAKAVEKTGVQTLSREVPDGENKPAATVNPYEETIAKLTGQAK